MRNKEIIFNPTPLIIISVLIVFVIFVLAALIYKIKTDKRTKEETNEGKEIVSIQRKNNLLLLKKECLNLFSDYNNDFDSMDINVNVGDFNREYKKRIQNIMNLKQYKSIIKDTKNDFYKESKFLEVIAKESPFVWNKKFKREIEDYYVK